MDNIMLFVAGSVVGYFAVLKIVSYKKAEKEKDDE